MEKTSELGAQHLRRHLSQLRILARVLEHELELAKADEVVIDKQLVESALDTLEIFIEDTDGVVKGSGGGERKPQPVESGKGQVTRLN
jgi:hypothetical protein